MRKKNKEKKYPDKMELGKETDAKLITPDNIVVDTSEISIEPMTRAILDFWRDEEDRNWVSKIPNGKFVILHRNSPWIPQPGIRYHCTLAEKERFVMAWITGFSEYPRLVIRADHSCVLVKEPSKEETKEQKIYSNIYEALETNLELTNVFVIYSKENKEAIKPSLRSKKIEMDITIKELGGLTFTENAIKLNISDESTPQDIIKELKRFFGMKRWTE